MAETYTSSEQTANSPSEFVQTNYGTAEPRATIQAPEPPVVHLILTVLKWLWVRAESQPPVRGREILAVVLLVVLADIVIYHGHGFAGYAAFFAAAPLLLVLGAPRLTLPVSAWIVGAMLVALVAKLVWSGSGLLVATGVTLVVALAMSLVGRRPYIPDLLLYACQTSAAGYVGLGRYWRSADKVAAVIPRSGWSAVMLPSAAVLVFGTLFVLANPDIARAVTQGLERFFTSFWERVLDLRPSGGQVLLWIVVAWIAIGLLRPVTGKQTPEFGSAGNEASRFAAGPAEAPLYLAYRNMLVALIGLFALYLVFEFMTLWFREFPEGFHYSGYAHEGAAWLTVALASATVVLSTVFRSRTFRDARLPRLQRLAWIWSAQNVLLALAVYNRLFIYIGFNGMTRMRVVGLLGISAVVIGFALVVWKIVHRRDFLWLVRRQLWALAIAVYLLAILPVDALVHSYNVRRILAGHPAPAVQISVHPIDASGVLVLTPLVNCPDEIIREGVRALLAERAGDGQALAQQREQQGWTSFQLADRMLLEKLRKMQSDWGEYTDPGKRAAALDRFHQYAYQWY